MLKFGQEESAVRDLKSLLDADLVTSSKSSFAKSLVEQFEKKGGLSDKQWFWVEKLIVQSIDRTVKDDEVTGLPVTVLLWLLMARERGVAYPKMVFTAKSDDLSLVFSLTGVKSKYPNTVAVADAVLDVYYGRILADGSMMMPPLDADRKSRVVSRITTICTHPHTELVYSLAVSGKCPLCDKNSPNVHEGCYDTFIKGD